jgi:hypothetical protein
LLVRSGITAGVHVAFWGTHECEHEESRIVQNKSRCVWELTRENSTAFMVLIG